MTRLYEYVYRLQDKISGTLNKINSAQQKVSGGFRKMEDDGTQAFRRTSSAASGLRNVLAGLGITLSTVFAFQAIKSIANLGIEAEQTRISFQTMLQDVEKGNKLFQEIQGLANVTPLTSQNLQKSATTLLSFNAATEKTVIPTLKMLGDVARGDANRLNSLTLAYGQMQSAGRLMGQDLLQMINVGFNPLQVISQQTGKSMAQLKKEMEAGAISAEMVTQAFVAATSEGGMFFNMMEKQSLTTGGRISTMIDKIQLTAMKLGEAMQPAINKVVDFIITLFDNINLLRPAFDGLMQALNPILVGFQQFNGQGSFAISVLQFIHNTIVMLTPAVKFLSTVLGGLIGFIGRNIELFKFLAVAILGVVGALKIASIVMGIAKLATLALNAAMMANPIGLVIGLIGALVAGIVYAWNKFEGFRGVVYGLWDAVKQVFKNIFDFAKKMIAPVAQLIAAIKSGDWGAAAKAGGQLLLNAATIPHQLAISFAKGEITKGVGDAYKGGYQKGVDSMKAKSFQETIGEQMAQKTPGMQAAASGNMGSPGIPTQETPKSVQTGIDSVSGGGSKPTNITINLDKLQEQIIINSGNLQEGVNEIERQVTDALLRVLNSANFAAN